MKEHNPQFIHAKASFLIITIIAGGILGTSVSYFQLDIPNYPKDEVTPSGNEDGDGDSEKSKIVETLQKIHFYAKQTSPYSGFIGILLGLFSIDKNNGSPDKPDHTEIPPIPSPTPAKESPQDSEHGKIKGEPIDAPEKLPSVPSGQEFLYDAIAPYEKALEIDPFDTQALVGKGDILELMRAYEKALYYYEKALKIEADNLDALYGLATVYEKMKMYDEVLEVLDKISTLNPNSTLVYYRYIE